MAISPEELRKKTFAVVPKGYDRPEVNRYLGEIADQLQQFSSTNNAGAETSTDSVHDNVGPAEATPASERNSPSDDFDRVGNEISLMLRQAQDSAMKIRDDAEIEARTLVDQVRLDIEADRVAHEQAAGQLVALTEERATSIRVAAEDYARETREDADDYAGMRKAEVDNELAEALSEAQAARQATNEHVSSANAEAEAIVSQARNRAKEILANAESDAQQRSDDLLDQARTSLQSLIEAENRTRHDLDQARRNISTVLDQLSIAELDNAKTSLPSTNPETS